MTLTPTLPNDAVISLNVGKVPSLNAFYASKHWIVRKKAKDTFKEDFLNQLNQYDKIEFKSVSVRLETNLGYDIDNCIMAVKFAMDALKDWGGVKDDTKVYFPKLTIIYNPDLEKNTSKIFFSGSLVDWKFQHRFVEDSNQHTMNYNLSSQTYESYIDLLEARVEAMQKRIDALEAVSNPVLNAELATQDFIFNKLFRWTTKRTLVGLRSA